MRFPYPKTKPSVCGIYAKPILIETVSWTRPGFAVFLSSSLEVGPRLTRDYLPRFDA